MLSLEEVRYKKNMEGKETLPLCGECVKPNIQLPLKPGQATNLVEKERQTKAVKNKKSMTRQLSRG